jgi:hypothetical protein
VTTYQTPDFALELPEHWKATELPERDLVVMHEEPYGPEEDPESLGESLLVQRIDPGDVSSLSDYAKRSMDRFVRQGHPSRSVARFGKVSAEEYEWTDGVAKIVTFFLEPSAHRWFRVEYSNKDYALGESDIKSRAHGLLRHILWRSPVGSSGGRSGSALTR